MYLLSLHTEVFRTLFIIIIIIIIFIIIIIITIIIIIIIIIITIIIIIIITIIIMFCLFWKCLYDPYQVPPRNLRYVIAVEVKFVK